MARIRLFSGPSRSGRARAIDDVLCDHWGRAVLLVPTAQAARERLERLLFERALPGAWGKPILTFQEFAQDLLASTGVFVKPFGLFERRLLLARAIKQTRAEGRLEALGPAADTPGFANHVLRTITQLKQAAIDPVELRSRLADKAGDSWRHQVVADVYSAYQSALHGTGAYDLVGIYWMAALMCREGRPPVLARVRTLLLDGFDDYTPSEFRLLQALRPHLDGLVFALNCEQDIPSQRDLYALPVVTADRIRNGFAPVETRSFHEPDPATFTEFAASRIFWRNQPTRSAGLKANLELMPCVGAVHEAEAIGRRVKSLLVEERVSASRIAVVYRSVSDAAGVIQTVFDEFGIPLSLHHKPGLSESAIGAFLSCVVEAVGSWKREEIVDVVASPWYRPDEDVPAGWRRAAPHLARMAGIVAGQAEWLSQLGYLRRRIESHTGQDVASLCERMADAQAAVAWLLKQAQFLVESGKGLKGQANVRAFAKSLEDILNGCRVETALKSPDLTQATREAEDRAYNALRGILARLCHWPHDDILTRAEFLTLFRVALEDTPYSSRQETEGVACLDAERIRHLEFDYVFFAGVNEGVVPRPPATNAIYTDQDIQYLRKAGVPVDDKHTHSSKEALLFHRVLAAAREHLCISWRTLSADGKPLAPSPFVDDVRELFPGAAIEGPPPTPGMIVPDPEEAASWRDLCNTALRTPEYGLWETLREEFPAVRHGVDVEAGRQGWTPFDRYDGMLTDVEAIQGIANRYGPNHQFSASQAETYTQCPFRFFVERVLGLHEVEAPSNELDSRERGRLMHEILQRFHSAYRGRPVRDVPEREACDAIAAIVEEVFASCGQMAPGGVVAAEARRMAALLVRYLAIARVTDEDWAPTHFEVAFGTQRGPEGEPPSRPDPYAMDTPEGAVLFSGRIDRVDEKAGDVRIIDYKTSVSITQGDFLTGASLQLGIYALALDGLLMPDSHCREARFLHVGRMKSVDALGRSKKNPDWDEREEALRSAVGTAVRGIREGRFPPTPHDTVCAYCPARQVCRYEPSRIDRKTQGT